MKLSELSTDRGMEVLAEIAIITGDILEDKELKKALFSKTEVTKELTLEERQELVYESILKKAKVIIPSILRTNKDNVLSILALINEKPLEEIKNQKVLVTMTEVMELFKDKDFVDFFSSQMN